MKVELRLILPLSFFMFSIGYLAFIVSSDSSTMIGDIYGYDPGGQAIPLISTVILAIAALWTLVTEIKACGTRPPLRFAPIWLIVANIAISLVFIAVFRPVGFLIVTCLAMHWLIYLNLRAAEGKTASLMAAFWWMWASLFYLIVMYAVLRGIIKTTFWLARTHGMLIMREPALQVGIVSIALLVLFLVTGKLFRKHARDLEMVNVVQTSIGTTLSIYVVFRLLFLVQLPMGILTL